MNFPSQSINNQPFNNSITAIDFHEFQNNLGDQSYLIVDVREPEELTRDGKIFGMYCVIRYTIK